MTLRSAAIDAKFVDVEAADCERSDRSIFHGCVAWAVRRDAMAWSILGDVDVACRRTDRLDDDGVPPP